MIEMESDAPLKKEPPPIPIMDAPAFVNVKCAYSRLDSESVVLLLTNNEAS